MSCSTANGSLLMVAIVAVFALVNKLLSVVAENRSLVAAKDVVGDDTTCGGAVFVWFRLANTAL
jgi:hypothetical protein